MSAGEGKSQQGQVPLLARCLCKTVPKTPLPTGIHHTDEGGTGFPVIFLSSFFHGAAVWAKQVVHLRKSFRCICIDPYGLGGSGPMPENISTMEDLATSYHTFLKEQLKVKAYAICGLGWGGEIAMVMASLFPETVACISCVNTAVSSDNSQRKTFADEVGRVVRCLGFYPHSIAAKIAASHAAPTTPPQVTAELTKSIENMDPRLTLTNLLLVDMWANTTVLPVLRTLKTPVQCLTTSGAQLSVTEDWTRKTSGRAKCIPDDMGEHGHAAPLEIPEPLADKLTSFLFSHLRGSASVY